MDNSIICVQGMNILEGRFFILRNNKACKVQDMSLNYLKVFGNHEFILQDERYASKSFSIIFFTNENLYLLQIEKN